ncbi:MAG TPA: iron uptake system protein EfeO [Trebonia sp.]|nr:iron uptake system protein EfeO [Trebonia sp.]
MKHTDGTTARRRALPPGPGPRGRRLATRAALLAVAAGLALATAACSSSHSSSASTTSSTDKTTAVTVNLTPQGCAPTPATIPAGEADFTVNNKGADAVSEAELRTSDLSKILGEQENLTPGLSGGFSLTLQPGTYTVNCPGAARQHWTFKVTGTQEGPAWQANPRLAAAVPGYGTYISAQTADLVTHTQAFCTAIDQGNLTQAEILYPQARVYYERIEPVAEVWGSLDTQIDGRWENPVTVASQFIGFHRLEQLLWEDNTLKGAPALCTGLLANEKQLLTLVRSAQYNPLEMASGATDLVNEAGTNKVSGEEERYSNTDFPVFQANIDAAMEVVTLLRPYLQARDPSLLTQVAQRDAAINALLAKYKATPGYDDTGYVEYSTVLDDQRKQLSTAVNAFAETLSKLSVQVSG